MTKICQLGTVPKQALGVESYLAPPRLCKEKSLARTATRTRSPQRCSWGQTPHDARKVGSRENLGLQGLLGWAAKQFGAQDLFVLEAGSNSFELCTRLHALGLRAVVLESCHVGKHAKTYAGNDKMAATRIALVYLAGNAPCVWVPDEQSRQRRELLHLYRKAVAHHTTASNSLRAYLNGNAIRPAKRNLELESTHQWMLKQRDWSPMQRDILAEHFGDLDAAKERRKARLYRLMAAEMSAQPMMLRCLKVLGVGLINAFALLAVIGRRAPLRAA
jgi:transposase